MDARCLAYPLLPLTYEMVDANVVVVLGPPSSDSYYIGVGRRVCHNNLPRTLVESIESGELSNITLNYISLDKDGKYWCSEEMIGPSCEFSSTLNQLSSIG